MATRTRIAPNFYDDDGDSRRARGDPGGGGGGGGGGSGGSHPVEDDVEDNVEDDVEDDVDGGVENDRYGHLDRTPGGPQVKPRSYIWIDRFSQY